MKLKNMYIGFVIKDFLLFVVLSWTSQRIFFNVINDDSTADAIAGVIVGIVIFCMTIYYFSRFLFFVIDLCEGIQQKRLRYKDTVNMANFKAILLSDRSEFVMKEHKHDFLFFHSQNSFFVTSLSCQVTGRKKRSREKI